MFHFQIEHRAGIKHANADALSRLPSCEQCDLKHDNPLKRRNVKVYKSDSEDDMADICNAMEICKPNHEHELSIIRKYHEMLGHVGIEKIVQVLKQKYR